MVEIEDNCGRLLPHGKERNDATVTACTHCSDGGLRSGLRGDRRVYSAAMTETADAGNAGGGSAEPLADEWWRRPFDLAFALAMLALASPLMLLAAALVKLTSRGPVLFTQERAGRGGEPFRVRKFRTMVAGAESEGAGLSTEKADARITGVGGWLRRLSIDELPQFLNVLGGSMSVVGPRPLPTRYLGRYGERQLTRLRVRPGITGWSQVTCRNLSGWDEKLELDAWYIEHRSFALDVKVMLLTPLAVLSGRGLEGRGGGVEEFRGPGGPGGPDGVDGKGDAA